jgi:hypothetical protein
VRGYPVTGRLNITGCGASSLGMTECSRSTIMASQDGLTLESISIPLYIEPPGVSMRRVRAMPVVRRRLYSEGVRQGMVLNEAFTEK